jgi:hypothetical protein
MWRPTDHETMGVKALGYRVLMIKLKEHLAQNSQPFGNSHHNYSMLLAPIATGKLSALDELGVPQLFDLADISSNGDKFFGIFLSIVGVISVDTLGAFLLKLACREPRNLLRNRPDMILNPPMSLRPYLLFWDLLTQETTARHTQAEVHALSELFPFFCGPNP